MIVVSGSPLDVAEMRYPQNSVEGQLLHIMNQSQTLYRYDSLKQLEFELMLRHEIINAARALNSSKLAFAVFHKSRCNQDYWTRTNNGGFRLIVGADPYEAISDIFTNGQKYATECATAMVIVFYRALSRVFSKDEFNKMFPSIYLMNWHSIDSLLRGIGNPKKVSEILLGDRAYFANPDVNPKTPELQGENVIVMPDKMYYGHGMGIKSAERIVATLNENRKEGATRTAYLMDAAARPDFKKLANRYYEYTNVPVSTLTWSAFPV